MRVATRRARSALQAFGEIVERERTRPLREELKWLATVLGQARDAEVLLARFTGELAAIAPTLVVGPVGTRIAGHFTGELEQARAAAVRELDGQRYLSLLDDLDVLLADPPLTPLAARKAGRGPGGQPPPRDRISPPHAVACVRASAPRAAPAQRLAGRAVTLSEPRGR